MRQFLVLGFNTTSTAEPGEIISIGTDRGEAIKAVNTDTGTFMRKELFELAVPQIRKQFAIEASTKKKTSKK